MKSDGPGELRTAIMRAMRVIGVVPAWRRGRELAELLDSVEQSDRPLDALVVVDNDASPEARAAYNGRGADVVYSGSNRGAVAGFEAGIRRAIALGADALWLLDDDSTVEVNALQSLLAVLASNPSAGGVAPAVALADGRRIAGWLWEENAPMGYGHAPNSQSGPIDWAPFAGLLLTREACERTGPMRDDLFLWHADVEYCLRLRRRGFTLIAVAEALVRHPVYALAERRALGRTFAVRVATPWQEYEDARNWAILARLLRNTGQRMRTPIWIRGLGEVKRSIAVIAADTNGLRRVAARVRGLLHGWRGRAPKRVPGAPPAALEAYRK